MTLTAISVDDEPRAHKIIAHYAAKIDGLVLVESFTSPVKAANFLNTNKVDIIFLDINMPDMDGISLLKTLKQRPMIIFTTAYDNYAVESYDYDAIGYLLKPIEFPKFYKAVLRVIELRMSEIKTIPTKAKPAGEADSAKNVLLKSGSKMLQIDTSKIRYISASGNYAELVLSAQQKVFVDHNLSELSEKHLPECFIRIHRSYIINKNYLSELESHQVKIGEIHLPMGKTYRSEVRRLVGA